MFTSVAQARQMSGVASSTITRFLNAHPEYSGAANANKPLPMNMIYDYGGDYGWKLFWGKPSSILPISINELNFLYDFLKVKNVVFTFEPLDEKATHAMRVEIARSMMDALPREMHTEMYEAMAKKMNPSNIQPAADGPIDELEPFQARGTAKTEASTKQVTEEKKAVDPEPKGHSENVNRALLKIARTFVMQQKLTLPSKVQDTPKWISEAIRGVVSDLSLSNKDRADLIALIDKAE